jgi:hypothetical protein
MTRWQEYKDKNGVTPLDIFKAEKYITDENIVNARFDICKACPELIKMTGTCKKCGCFMQVKTKLQGATCPIGKW